MSSVRVCILCIGVYIVYAICSHCFRIGAPENHLNYMEKPQIYNNNYSAFVQQFLVFCKSFCSKPRAPLNTEQSQKTVISFCVLLEATTKENKCKKTKKGKHSKLIQIEMKIVCIELKVPGVSAEESVDKEISVARKKIFC